MTIQIHIYVKTLPCFFSIFQFLSKKLLHVSYLHPIKTKATLLRKTSFKYFKVTFSEPKENLSIQMYPWTDSLENKLRNIIQTCAVKEVCISGQTSQLRWIKNILSPATLSYKMKIECERLLNHLSITEKIPSPHPWHSLINY